MYNIIHIGTHYYLRIEILDVCVLFIIPMYIKGADPRPFSVDRFDKADEILLTLPIPMRLYI